jgi:hypothetical protein
MTAIAPLSQNHERPRRSLSSILEQKRKDSTGTDWYFSQHDVGRALKKTQGTISNIERDGENDLRQRPPKFVLTFLQQYRFTDLEIQQLAKDYNLELPVEFVLRDTLMNVRQVDVTPNGVSIPTYLMPTSPKGGLNTLKEANLREVVDPGWPGTHNAFVLDPADNGVQTTVIIRMLTQEEKPHPPLGSYLLYEHEGVVGLAVLVEVEDSKYFFNDRNGKIFSRSGIRLLGVQRQIRIENLPR